MTLAPGVSFDEAKHEYYYKGKRLSGVTGLIAKMLGFKMPQEFLEEHREEGIHIHKAIQNWINTGKSGSIHPTVAWITETLGYAVPGGLLEAAGHISMRNVFSEVLVSDLKQYASAVDIVVERGDDLLDIYDIKKGVFKRDYVTWQLSIYKYFIEKFTVRKVNGCFCICGKDREYYDIFPKPFDRVEKLLYGR